MTITVDEIEETLAEVQPQLDIVQSSPSILVEGIFQLKDPSDQLIDNYEVRIEVDPSYPKKEPIVFETGNRIQPRTKDMHMHPNGACCTGVWESWLAEMPDSSFRSFLQDPVHIFFLSQWFFEKNGEWRFGFWDHGDKGLRDAYRNSLRLSPDCPVFIIRSYLEVLSRTKLKKWWDCPCGSALQIKDCHLVELAEAKKRIPNYLAKRMLAKLDNQEPQLSSCHIVLPGLPQPRK